MAGKTAFVGKVMMDKIAGSTSLAGNSSDAKCLLCETGTDVITVPKCMHTVCSNCATRDGKNIVCPVEDCYETFFHFTINNAT